MARGDPALNRLLEGFSYEDRGYRNECWITRRRLNTTGYVQVFTGRKAELGHRVTYREYRGEIPEGRCLDHLCRVRECVNPWHLEAVTQQENILRGAGVAARNARATHCPKGHELTGEPGRRKCRACLSESNRKWLSKPGNLEKNRAATRECQRRRRMREAG